MWNQSSDIGVQDDEIEIIEESSLNDSRGGHAEERQHSVSQIVSTTEYDSSRYGHSNGSFETGMHFSLLIQSKVVKQLRRTET